MARPYIGVTGFMKLREAEHILNRFPLTSKYAMMVGVLASQKTMRGIKNRRTNRYPEPDKVKKIFPDHPLALNLVHYNTKEPETLCRQLLDIVQIAGPYFHGFQLNFVWPDPCQLDLYSENSLKRRIVLQVSERAFEMIGHSPQKLADKIRREYPGVDYLILDPSGGYGKLMDVGKLREYLSELYARDLRVKPVIAGGLSPETLDLIRPLVEEFPDLSIDAESRLRDSEDNLDLNIASEYATKALRIFGQLR